MVIIGRGEEEKNRSPTVGYIGKYMIVFWRYDGRKRQEMMGVRSQVKSPSHGTKDSMAPCFRWFDDVRVRPCLMSSIN